jgi:VanZ family protein
LGFSNKQLLWAWLPAVAWMGLIAVESTDWLSAHHTGRILYPMLHYLFGVDEQGFETWHFLIRKGGHVFGYAMLSWLVFRACRATLPMIDKRGRAFRWAGMAIGVTTLVASLDEWHQSFLPSRTGTPHDVLLDAVAGLSAQVLILLCLLPSRRRA